MYTESPHQGDPMHLKHISRTRQSNADQRLRGACAPRDIRAGSGVVFAGGAR